MELFHKNRSTASYEVGRDSCSSSFISFYFPTGVLAGNEKSPVLLILNMSYLPFSHFLIPQIPNVDIYFWKLDESAADLSAMLPDATLLAEPPYVNFKSEKRKQEWLASRVLLSRVYPQQPLKIEYEESGRPYLNPAVAEFSISHTKGMACIALSREAIGVDIEQISERAFHLRDHFLQEDEFDFESVDDPALVAVFLWSAKESVYKLVNLPGTELKADIRLKRQNGHGQYLEFSAGVNSVSRPILVRCYPLEGLVLTVATYSD